MTEQFNNWSPNPADWSPQKQQDAARWAPGGQLQSPLPTWPAEPAPHPRRRRPVWPWVTLAAALAVIGGIITLVLTLTADNGYTVPFGKPGPISRSELMAEYARIAPKDRTATPETIDEIAVSTCGLFDTGTSTDRVISAATDIYGANATQVIRLLVSYKCPAHLKDFK